MKFKILCILVILMALSANLIAVFYENITWEQAAQLLFLGGLFGIFFKKLPSVKRNFLGFFLCLLGAVLMGFLNAHWYFSHISSGLWIISLSFLIQEGVQFTQYSRGSRFVEVYFVLVVALYTYLLSLHILEMEASITSDLQLVMYLIYYVNLLILAITALVYYLNSFSRKSVYFICFALALIFSDVLRDMGVFYFKDLSVELVGGLMKSAALVFSFLFFVTKERKLRLLNLV